jgi:hypothetical protein
MVAAMAVGVESDRVDPKRDDRHDRPSVMPTMPSAKTKAAILMMA